MKSIFIILTTLLVGSQASIFSSFTKATTTTPGTTNDETTVITTTSTESSGSFVSAVMDQVFGKLEDVNGVLDKAVQATMAAGHVESLEKLREMKNQMSQVVGTIQSFDYKNVSNVAAGLEQVGKKLLGVSGNATEVKQQLLNKAIKGITDGTFCKSPAQLAVSLSQHVLANIPGLPGGDAGGGSSATAAAIVGTLAKTSEGAGTLSTGLGVALGAAKCLGKVGAVVGTVGTGGALAPLLMLLGSF